MRSPINQEKPAAVQGVRTCPNQQQYKAFEEVESISKEEKEGKEREGKGESDQKADAEEAAQEHQPQRSQVQAFDLDEDAAERQDQDHCSKDV